MSKKSKLTKIREEIERMSKGSLKLNADLRDEMKSMLRPTIKHFYELPVSVQLGVKWSYDIRGKFAVKKGEKGGYIFQMSNGQQQIKKYDPDIYKNNHNTPLRIRARTIMHIAKQGPKEKEKETIRELYRKYPYHLLKDKEERIKLTNFYFNRPVRDNDYLKIYRAADKNNLNPETDTLYAEILFAPKETVNFEYCGQEEEYYYALNSRNNELSNLLRFIWQDELESI